MVYIIGMSHIISVLKAASAADQPFSLENWSSSAATEFAELATRPGLFPGDRIKTLIVSAQGWGGMATLRVLPSGKKEVVAVDGYIELLRGLQPRQEGACLISMLNGNEHSALTLVQHAVPYDFQVPGRTDLPLLADAQPVSYEVIRRHLEPWLNATIASLAMARMMLPAIRLVHVFPPPPVESNEQIMLVPELFREHLMYYGITPLSVRVKYYLLAKQIVRETLAGLGLNIEFLDAPPQAVGPAGGLLDPYVAGATHGNQAYGELVALQMRDLLN